MADVRYTFSPFVLAAVAGVLSRDGKPLTIGKRGAALLTALILEIPVPKMPFPHKNSASELRGFYGLD